MKCVHLALFQGEHTDYQDGFVFPVALSLKCFVALSINDTGKYRIITENLKEEIVFHGGLPTEPPVVPQWHSYILGTINLYCKEAGVPLPKGMNLLCYATVPLGAGLSSSAALEVATATA